MEQRITLNLQYMISRSKRIGDEDSRWMLTAVSWTRVYLKRGLTPLWRSQGYIYEGRGCGSSPMRLLVLNLLGLTQTWIQTDPNWVQPYWTRRSSCVAHKIGWCGAPRYQLAWSPSPSPRMPASLSSLASFACICSRPCSPCCINSFLPRAMPPSPTNLIMQTYKDLGSKQFSLIK